MLISRLSNSALMQSTCSWTGKEKVQKEYAYILRLIQLWAFWIFTCSLEQFLFECWQEFVLALVFLYYALSYWFKNLCYFLDQSAIKPKPIVICSHKFSHTAGYVYFLGVLILSVSFVIGRVITWVLVLRRSVEKTALLTKRLLNVTFIWYIKTSTGICTARHFNRDHLITPAASSWRTFDIYWPINK